MFAALSNLTFEDYLSSKVNLFVAFAPVTKMGKSSLGGNHLDWIAEKLASFFKIYVLGDKK